MSKTKIEDVLTQLRDARASASTNLEEVPVKLRPGRQMLKQTSTDALPGLTQAVLDATIPVRLVGVFASGDPTVQEAVAKFMQDNDGIVLDGAQIYREVQQYVEPAYGDAARQNRSFSTVHFARMMSLVREKADALGIKLEGQPTYEEAICPNAGATLAQVRKLLRSAFGDQLTVAALKLSIVDAVISGNLVHKRIPVLVLNTREEERAGLAALFARAREFDFAGDFQTTEESVTAIFKGK